MRRLLTSLVGIPILSAAIWWGFPWLTILLAIAVVLGVMEFYHLFRAGDASLPTTLGSIWALAFLVAGQTSPELTHFLTSATWIFLAGAFVSVLWFIAFHQGPSPIQASAYLVLGPVYVGFLLSHALLLREYGDFGRDWLFFALLVTFATDTGAFLVGRSVGRHQMAPAISPNKTWEGAIGGLVLAVLASLALGLLLDLALDRWQQALIGATVGVVAQLGDLSESTLKRVSQVKDAGSIIPGHGGILDRLDSLVFSIPSVYYLLNLVFKQ
jgi:phosphatidate cytidylyltransferase